MDVVGHVTTGIALLAIPIFEGAERRMFSIVDMTLCDFFFFFLRGGSLQLAVPSI